MEGGVPGVEAVDNLKSQDQLERARYIYIERESEREREGKR